MMKNCPLCGTKLILTQISFTTAIFMCNNLDCKYPVDNECMYIENNIEEHFKNIREEKKRVAVKNAPKSRYPVNSGGISLLDVKTVRRKHGITKKIEEKAPVEDDINKSRVNTECRTNLNTEITRKDAIKNKIEEKGTFPIEHGTNSQYPVSTKCVPILEIKDSLNIENGTNIQYPSVNAEYCDSIEEFLSGIIGGKNNVEKQNIEEKSFSSSVVEENDLIDFDTLLNNYIDEEEIKKNKIPQDSSLSDDLSKAYLDDFFTDLLN